MNKDCKNAVQVLCTTHALIEGGGVEKKMYDWISRFDRQKISVDILAGQIISVAKKKEFECLGCHVYELGCSMWNIRKRLPVLKAVLSNKYDVIHIHSSTPVDAWMLAVAQKQGVKTRIIHSHNAVARKKLTTFLAFEVCKPFLRKYATHFWGCSEKAIYTLCGKTKKITNNHRVIKNGIQIEKYLFNESIRNEIRNKYKLTDKFVIGNVGRLCSQKNQLFLLDVFVQILKQKTNALLLLIGDGDQKTLLERKAQKLGISENIFFTGNVPNTSDFYQAMDVYTMPSRYEGLGIAGIEAQCSGLHCVFSSAITREVKITDNAEFISLKKSPSYWAERICLIDNKLPRKNMLNEIKNAGYDIETAAKNLQDLYLKLRESVL